MSRFSFTSKMVGAILLVVFTAFSALAQQTDPSYTNGVIAYHTYLGGTEDINLGTGNVSVQLPLLHLPGRNGHDLNLTYSYNSHIWWVFYPHDINPYAPPDRYFWIFQNGGNFWSLNLAPKLEWQDITVGGTGPVSTNETCTYYKVRTAEGRLIDFNFPVRDGCWTRRCDDVGACTDTPDPQNTNLVGDSPGSGAFCSKDFMRLSLVGGPHMIYKSGETVWFDTGGITREVDTNGNTITYNNSGNQPGEIITDTVGRTITINPGPSSIVYQDSSGQTQTININYTAINLAPTFSPSNATTPAPRSMMLPSSVVLPNGDRWDMEYNNFAELTKITYPTGGYTRYTYAPIIDNNAPSYDYRGVTGRYVCRDSGARASGSCPVPEDATTITATGSSDGIATSAVVDAAGNQTLYAFEAGGIPFETQRKIYAGTSTLLETVDTVQSCGVPSQQTITLANNGLVSQTQWDHNDVADNPTAVREYDWGSGAPGPLMRQTQIGWLHTNPVNNVNYLGLHIFNRKASETVIGADNNVKAQTLYSYDSTPVQGDLGGAPQHDSNFSTSYTTRGNLTQVQQWLYPGNTDITTKTNSYDDLGNLRQTTDANGNSTTYNYSDNWYDATGCVPAGSNTQAHVTQVTNALNQTSKASFYQCSGLVGQSQDANDIANNRAGTTHTYDLINRPLLVTSPDGGQTTYSYDDTISAFSPSMKVQQQIDGRQTQSLTLYDGLGRAHRTETLNDEDPTHPYDQVDTCFDGLGQKIFQTYPYRSTGFNASKACSNAQQPGETFTYDALGRAKQVMHADNSAVTTDYSQFPTVTVADEAGNARRSRSDAVGRLLEVDEPGVMTPAAAGSVALTITGGEQSTATPGTGSVTISGALQSKQVQSQAATAGTGSVTISGSEQFTTFDPCAPNHSCPQTIPDGGTVSITVNGSTVSVGYGASSDANSLAAALASQLNSAGVVTATASGSTITLTATTTGAATNYSLSGASNSQNSRFSGPSFFANPSGPTLTGGQDTAYTTIYDSGSATITVNGHSDTVPWSGANTTPASIAFALASKIHTDSGAYADASPSGATVVLTSKILGAGTNYPLSSSLTYDSSNFTGPSFTSSSPPALSGGADNGGIYDAGTVTVTVAGFSTTASYGRNDTTASVAASLANALSVAASPVNASATNATLTITAKNTGALTNYGFTSASTYDTGHFPHSSFSLPASGTLGGGAEAVYSLSTPAVTLYSYDTLGNLTGVQQQGNSSDSGQWRPRSFGYDSLSRLLSATNPESGTINYGYDLNGNLTSKTSPAPNQTDPAQTITYQFGYDALNRLIWRWHQNSSDPVERYTYDLGSIWGTTVHNPIGRMVADDSEAADPAVGNQGTVHSYDVMGREEFELQYNKRGDNTVHKQFNYAYNLDGSLKSITYPSGRVLTYQYNQAQRPISAVDGGGVNFASAAQYTAWGALSSFNNGSTGSFPGIKTTNSYNARMQPTELKTVAGASTILDLGYDLTSCGGNNGNVCGLINNKDSSRTQSFAYDALNRLTQAWTPNTATWRTSYLYDPWGNLLQKAKVVGYQAGDPQAAGMGINSVNGSNQVTNWCYDAAGNVVGPNNPCSTYANNHTPYENVYDGENRLTQTTVGGVTSYYDYDAAGQRVKKTGSTNTLYWHGPGGEVLEETDLSGTLTNEYIFFGGERTARYNPTSGYTFYFSDHLGSADVVTDALGNIKEESDYYPFGGERIVTDLGIGNNYKFTGKERDPETGCDYFGARYYCNPIGRFITPDWAASPTAVPYAHFGNPQSLNLYSYVQNNPTTFGDPDGHCFALCVGDVIVAAAVVATVAVIAVGVAYTTPRGRAVVNSVANDISNKAGNAVDAVKGAFAYQGDGTYVYHGSGISTAPYGVNSDTIFTQNTSASSNAQQQGAAQQGAQSTPAQPSGGTSGGPRAGKPFTPKGKKEVKAANATQNGGQTKCAICGQPTVPAQQSQSGVTPPGNETHVDHIIPQSKNGDGSPSNGQVLCRTCNLDKSNH